MKRWFGRDEAPVAPDELRAIREDAALTPEALAEVMGVMPLEVAAWESGAVSVERYPAEVMRWRVRTAAYEAALPRSGCEWVRTHAGRLEQMREVGPYGTRQAERELAEHERACAECTRVQLVLRDVPPPPERPVEPGFWGRLPWQLVLASVLGFLYLAYKTLRWLGGAAFDPSLAEVAFLLAGGAWAIYLPQRLAPLEERHPRLYGQIAAAGIILPLYVVYGLLGHADLSGPGDWITAALCSALLGAMIGFGSEDEREELLRLNASLPADGARTVTAPQQAAGSEPSPDTRLLRGDT